MLDTSKAIKEYSNKEIEEATDEELKLLIQRGKKTMSDRIVRLEKRGYDPGDRYENLQPKIKKAEKSGDRKELINAAKNIKNILKGDSLSVRAREAITKKDIRAMVAAMDYGGKFSKASEDAKKEYLKKIVISRNKLTGEWSITNKNLSLMNVNRKRKISTKDLKEFYKMYKDNDITEVRRAMMSDSTEIFAQLSTYFYKHTGTATQRKMEYMAEKMYKAYAGQKYGTTGKDTDKMIQAELAKKKREKKEKQEAKRAKSAKLTRR